MSERTGAGHRFVERVWFGDDRVAALTRAMLVPVERLFGGVVGARDVLYEAGWLATRSVAIPAVSVGNLTVGGTGKTPIAAWIAAGLVARGARPAMILRGYGDDEPLVHKTLNPDVPVVVGADRVDAIARAAAAGANIAVLDDAFQHRRARRVADLVVVSADRWTGETHLLPAGPWREPLGAVRRASLVIVTRKAAPAAKVDEVHRRLADVAPAIPRVSVHLSPGELVAVASDRAETRPLVSLQGERVHAVLSIGDPAAFVAQLVGLGAAVTSSEFPDHHRFTAEDVAAVRRAAGDSVRFVCTLKDAVKLGPLWPRLGPPLWYVSQRVTVERGVGGIEHILDDLVRAISAPSRNAG